MKPKILADFQVCISVPLKTTTAMNPKISVVVISDETSIYLLLRICMVAALKYIKNKKRFLD